MININSVWWKLNASLLPPKKLIPSDVILILYVIFTGPLDGPQYVIKLQPNIEMKIWHLVVSIHVPDKGAVKIT